MPRTNPSRHRRRAGARQQPWSNRSRRWILALAGLTIPAALLGTAPASQGATRPTNAEIYFRLENPCPATGQTAGACKGYVVDRVIPLFCGGTDEASNMRWLTVAEAREKARWDKIGCRKGRKLVLPGQDPPRTDAYEMNVPEGRIETEPLPP